MGSSLDAFSGAHHFTVNSLNITQEHSTQNTKYVINYNSASQPIQLSQLLKPIKDASHKRNRQLAPPDSLCLPGTRLRLFEEIHSWVKNEIVVKANPMPNPGSDSQRDGDSVHICWLYGFVGCGKSAIAQSIAEDYARKSRLAASFFFFRNAGDRSSIDRFPATLAHQISSSVPGAKALIEQAIMDDQALKEPTCSLEYQLEGLVYGPLLAALGEGVASVEDPYLMLVDGLDECMDKKSISIRIEEHIQTHIEGEESIHLIDLVSRSSRPDVASLMKATFTKARKHDRALRELGDNWPEPRDMDQLVDYCDGSFIFGSTITRFIFKGWGEKDFRTPMERLPLALRVNPGLDGVYIEVLSRAQELPHFQVIVSTVACVQTPISIATMAALLCLSTYDVIRVLVVLQAILQIPGRDDVPVSLFHTSLRDFLVDGTRSGAFHSPPSHHAYLMHRCLDLLFGMDPSTNVECCKYAMVYWPSHLEIASKLDETFDWKSATTGPYKPFGAEDFALKSTFKASWAKGRPLHLVLSEGDWAVMMRNFRKADVAIRSRGLVDETTIIPGQYYEDQADKSQWLLTRTEGQGRRFRPVVRVDSSRACSIKDTLQGFCSLMSATNDQSWKLNFAIRRSKDISVNIEFNRTGVASSEDERYQIPGGFKVTIRDGLSVGLYNFITRP